MLKNTLPVEIITNTINVISHEEITTLKYFLLDFTNEKKIELDNSINSLVGCCSLGTGHLELVILMGNLGLYHCSKNFPNHKIFLFQVGIC